MPSGRNTVTATSSGPNGRPPGAGSRGIRGRAPKARTSPSRWCSNPCSCPSANSSCSRSRHAGAYGHLRRLRHRRPHQMDERHLCRRQKTGRHPHRTQLFGPDPRADDRGHRHQRQPACVRPRTAQPRVDGGRQRPHVRPPRGARILPCLLHGPLRPARTGRKGGLAGRVPETHVPAGRNPPSPPPPTARSSRPSSKAYAPRAS